MKSTTKKTSRGRPKVHTTKRALKRAAKEHQDTANKKRNDRYEADPEFRAKERARARRNYAAQRKKVPRKGFGLRAGKAEHAAITVELKDGSSQRLLGIREMAFVCNVVPKVLKGWIDDAKFPKPTVVGTDRARYYTIGKADRLAVVLKNGLKDRGAFRKTDRALITQLHSTQ